MAVSYEEYTHVYCGGFPFPGLTDDDRPPISIHRTSVFRHYRAKAVAQLERYKRIYTVRVPGNNECDPLTPEQRAICAMIEAYMIRDAAKEAAVRQVSSATIGSVSVNYGSAPDKDTYSAKALERELYRCASQYLEIYRGVG